MDERILKANNLGMVNILSNMSEELQERTNLDKVAIVTDKYNNFAIHIAGERYATNISAGYDEDTDLYTFEVFGVLDQIEKIINNKFNTLFNKWVG